MDVVFAHQDGTSHFGGDKTAGGVAFWLCELNQTLLVLQERGPEAIADKAASWVEGRI